LQTQLQGVKLKKDRFLKETEEDIATAMKFNESLSKETENEKILEIINDDDIKKSSVLNLDLEEL
jgi:hypothetical protein